MPACRFSEYQCKEVINVCDGCRLGCVCDLEVELPEGRICAIYVPGPCRFFGLLGRDGWYRIPWPCIKRIGSDIILVETELPGCRVGRERKRWGRER